MKKFKNLKNFKETMEYLEKNIPLEKFIQLRGSEMPHTVHVLLHTARNKSVRAAIHKHFGVKVSCGEGTLHAKFKKLNLDLTYPFDWATWSYLYKKYNKEELEYSVNVVRNNLMYNGVYYELLTKINYRKKDYYLLERTFKTLHDEQQINGRMFAVVFKKDNLKFKLISPLNVEEINKG